jgi:23S rRNA (guanosine2251-2'-O)-methyltransferase
MGNVFEIKVHHSKDIIATINDLKRNGSQILAAEICDGSIALEEANFSDKFCLIFGSEGNGIQTDILNICDNIVHIPISNIVPSINVAASSAVFLHHIKNKFS